MPVPTDITAGTLTITNGSTAVTGVGTAWLASDLRQGDILLWIEGGDGFQTPILADVPSSNTALTLVEPWEGPTLSGARYRIRYQWDSSRVSAQSRQLIERLDNGNILSFASLAGPGVPVFDGPHNLVIKPEADFINGVNYDVQVNTLADRAAYDGQTAGFTVLVSDVGDGRSAIYSKASNTVGDWTDPAYVTGPASTVPGPQGPGFTSRGEYSGATAYVVGDVVQNNGSSWVARTATTGNAPPSLPTTSNTWWELIARAGADGAGTVAGVSAGTGVSVNSSNPALPEVSIVPFLPDNGTLPGTVGGVPAPAAGDATAGRLLSADGTWVDPPSGGGGGIGVNIMSYGASPSNPDNTAAYNAAIAALPNGTHIFWPPMAGVWKGHFVAPAGRSFKLDLGGNTFSETGGNYLFHMTGSAAIVTTLTADAKYGNTVLTVASSAGLAAGDLIMLEDDFVRPDGGNKINQEILRVKGILSGTSIRVEDCVRSEQKVGTRNVYKITPVVGAEIKNGRAAIIDPWDPTRPPLEGNANSPFRIDYSSGSRLFNLESNNSYGEGINLRYAYDFEMSQCRVFDGYYRTTGGYGVSLYVGRRGFINSPMTRNTRNGTDLSASYDVVISDAYHDDCYYGISIAHNIVGGKITIIRANIFNLVAGQGSRGIGSGTQGLTNANAVNNILRDITIKDCEIQTLALSTSAIEENLIYLPASVSNLLIDGVVGRFPGTQTKPTATTAIVRLWGQAYGQCIVRNVKTRQGYDSPGGTPDFYGVGVVVNADNLAASTTGVYGVLIIENCYNGYGQNVVYVRGIRNLITENLTFSQGMTEPRNVGDKNGVTLTVNQNSGYVGAVG